MDIEASLIQKIVGLKDIATPIKRKVSTDFFYSTIKTQYKFLLKYYQEYGTVPTEDVMRRNFPGWKLEPPDEPLEYFCDELRTRQRYNLIVKGIQDVGKKLDTKEIDVAYQIWQQMSTQLSIETSLSRDLDVTRMTDERFELYQVIKKCLGMTGTPYPWMAFNESTGGIQSEDFIGILGWQSVGKTWILLYILLAAWLAGKRVLLMTMEMSGEQMQRRFDALFAQIPYNDLKLGRLGEQLESKYLSKLSELKDMHNFIICGDFGGTLSAARAKIEEHKPDIWAIDGLYLLQDEEKGDSGWQKITNLTQGCKRLCKTLQIPGVVTSQANVESQGKHGVQLTNQGFSKSLGQDADVVIGVDLAEPHWLLKMLKNREGVGPKFVVARDFDSMRFVTLGEATLIDPEDENGIVY